MPQSFDLGTGAAARRIAVEVRPGLGPAIVWMGGFRSDMRGTKAEALDAFAARSGRAFVRFDYSGHGESTGRFEDGTISLWLEDTLAVLERFVPGPAVFVGSSMGGWIALLATRWLRENAPERAPAGLVLIAPAVDFTERLMWPSFTPEIRETIHRDGVFVRPSLYADDGYPITRGLIEDGRANLLMDAPIVTGCPVHILQGMEDPDVPWRHALATMEHMPGDSVAMTLIRDGDHRLSRPEDIAKLVAAVEAIVPAGAE